MTTWCGVRRTQDPRPRKTGQAPHEINERRSIELAFEHLEGEAAGVVDGGRQVAAEPRAGGLDDGRWTDGE
jgi:hypothetical protein